MIKGIWVIVICLFMVSVFSITALAADQSITTLPLAGINVEYERSLSDTTSFTIGFNYIGLADESSEVVLYGMDFGRKWYFGKAQQGGYFGLQTGYKYAYSITDSGVGNGAACLYLAPILGSKKIKSSGYTYDIGIGYLFSASASSSDNLILPSGLLFKLGVGLGW